MKALLVNPHKLIPSSWSITQRASPPLGLAYIAGVLEQQGWDVSVYDCIAEGPDNYFPFAQLPDTSAQGAPFDTILQSLEAEYDLIGMGVMFSNNWLINRHLINILKEKYPQALVIAGGGNMYRRYLNTACRTARDSM